VVDAAMGENAKPGRIRHWTPADDAESSIVSSHAFGLPQTYALGEALEGLPEKLSV
jgi:hydrogenase maturation protease